MELKRFTFAAIVLFCAASIPSPGQIPSAAWRIPIGASVSNPGGHRPELGSSNIDDGFWQGAPVGGIGAGTFSRTYRGNFERWHIKAGTHKFQKVTGNQFW